MLPKDPQAAHPGDWTLKGLPQDLDGVVLEDLAAGPSLFDGRMIYPVAVLRDSALRANSAWMRAFLAMTGARIAPHGKTTMAPDLFRLQIEDGAWAITAATAHHVRAYRRFGVERIFMANQLVGPGEIDLVVDELKRDPGFDFYCLVDSPAGVDALADGVARGGLDRPLKVLIEVGRTGGRTGARSVEEGLVVADAIRSRAPAVQLAGIETFEGVFQSAPDGEGLARDLLERVIALAKACDARGDFGDAILLSAGGSSFFDLVAGRFAKAGLSRPVEVVIRSGCYLTHDDGLYAGQFERLRQRLPAAKTLGALQPALQLWAIVQSMPEPGKAICAFGRRDAGTDSGLPQPQAWARVGDGGPRSLPEGHVVTGLFDQHALMDVPAGSPLAIGDLVGFGISHPCTTFDKWRALYRVDDDYRVTGVVRTYF